MLNIKERDANTVQAPEADTKILFLDAADSKLKTKDSSGVLEEISIAGGGASYLVYSAIMTQSDTDAPIVTVLENTLGGAVVWTRADVGRYVGTLTGAFPLNKTSIGNGEDSACIVIGYDLANDQMTTINRVDLNSVQIRNYGSTDFTSPADGIYSGIFVEIKVYP